jgi:voltage-gated potassium channel
MIKKKIYSVIADINSKSRVGKAFDVFMSCLIVANVIFIIADTFQNRPMALVTASKIVEYVSVVIFTMEYCLRLWTANLIRPELRPLKARLRYVISGMAIIDLLAILPFYIPFIIPVDLRVLRMIRLIRLIRIFKISRYTSALSRIGRVLKKNAPELISSVSVVFVLMVISSVLMYYVESPVQPDKFNSAFSGFWWAVATLTTVGYGDIYPVTGLGKVISAVIALLGIGIVALPTGIISAGFLDDIKHNDKQKPHPE